ncbi:hypothetical protein [Clostridium sp. B9]|uniref:hypothetical protein n=1 Tax=Clostridium sp. B9 TaxID=3423224 RepID=UPI003D2EC33A
MPINNKKEDNKSFEIEKLLLEGVTREELNKKYFKGTVTRVYNKLIKAGKIKEECKLEKNNEKLISNLLKEILELVGKNKEYKLEIKVKDCTDKKDIKTNKRKVNVINLDIFDLYEILSDKEFITYLSKKDKNILINTIKEYFTWNKKVSAYSEEELANYINIEINKVVKKGDCFK